ncbi:MAG: hypothetical protein HQL50_12575 [Magnetococcales bacterium]|nr:hypothetical protein [Magnetococcales bacterium]
MGHDPDRYVMLISTLPHLGKLFDPAALPISRTRLEDLLTLHLLPEDRQRLQRIETLLEWAASPREVEDTTLVTSAETLFPQVDSATLRRVVRDQLYLRTIVTALRRRARGESPPPSGTHWGFGRWRDTIRGRWQEPTFGLGGVFPWIAEANTLLLAKKMRLLERLLLQTLWDRLAREGVEHPFDFEAVVLYILRWKLIRHWSSYSGEAAVVRFRELVDEGLTSVPHLFESEPIGLNTEG